ncbi:hypothetical protein MKJ04_01825 [Pontibacter sp. E15-1]|uniref:hypothetical protein n=1 Tax=Pontibacter sp. E15-1 TaxID=2919918 RepID=UPI001F501625|nr:hypothetical protein [Pontibacter sp. E15-1]MCJ8163562.1 hypothetical protein [Pontibacter sp. E15-1]
MNKFALLFPALAISCAAFSQSAEPSGIDAQRNLMELGSPPNSSVVRVYDNRYEGVKGTPFFYIDWMKATITSGNKLYDNLEVKYNVIDNELLYRNPDGKEFVLRPQFVDSFTLRDSLLTPGLTFRKYAALANVDPALSNRFAVSLYHGTKLQLVMVPQKNFIKANFEGPYSSGNKYDEIRDDQRVYLLAPENSVQQVKLSKKNLLKALPDKQDEVQRYLSANKTDASTTAGWIKALAYYESL